MTHERAGCEGSTPLFSAWRQHLERRDLPIVALLLHDKQERCGHRRIVIILIRKSRLNRRYAWRDKRHRVSRGPRLLGWANDFELSPRLVRDGLRRTKREVPGHHVPRRS